MGIPAGIGFAIEVLDVEIVRRAGRSRHEAGLGQLRGADLIDDSGRDIGAVDHPTAAVGRRRAVVEIVGQRVIFGIAAGKQRGERDRLPGCGRRHIGAGGQADRRGGIRRGRDIDVDVGVPAGIGEPVEVLDVEIVRRAGRSGHETGLRQLRGADGIDDAGRNDGAVDHPMAAAGRRRAVIEVVGQRVAVGIAAGKQRGERDRLPGRGRRHIGAGGQADRRGVVHNAVGRQEVGARGVVAESAGLDVVSAARGRPECQPGTGIDARDDVVVFSDQGTGAAVEPQVRVQRPGDVRQMDSVIGACRELDGEPVAVARRLHRSHTRSADIDQTEDARAVQKAVGKIVQFRSAATARKRIGIRGRQIDRITEVRQRGDGHPADRHNVAGPRRRGHQIVLENTLGPMGA